MATSTARSNVGVTVALAGNPNVGKSTLFNSLTGLHQHVGNWIGKTVERKEGAHRLGSRKLTLVDLPGTYSLSALSPEELIAREFIAQEVPDVVINLVDASNLERNLYLTMQLLELTDRVVVALNMMDLAESKGLSIDVPALEKRLGIPVIPLIAERKQGQTELLQALQRVLDDSYELHPLRAELPEALQSAVGNVAALLDSSLLGGYAPQWYARKLIEGDPAILALTKRQPGLMAALQLAGELSERPEFADIEADVIEAQYELLSGVMQDVLARKASFEDITDRIDRLVTHRVWGFPILTAVFATMFYLTFSLGAGTPFNSWFSGLLEQFGGWLRQAILAQHASQAFADFMVDGIWAGFATVAGFFPLIAVYFTAFAILEDSGYLARAAFVVDRFMGAIGLHGRSFLPLLMGFGCNVPAIMATRILDNRSDRLITILVNPLMICQARLIVLVFFAGTFFQGLGATLVMLSLYALSILLVLCISWTFKKTLFPGEPAPFIMELPPYHRPMLRNIVTHAWRATSGFLERAGGQITLMTGVIWLFTHLPVGSIEHSFAGMLGQALAPIGQPMGLDWRLMVSLLSGFLAKEGTLASLAVLYGTGESGLAGAVRHAMTPLTATSFMVVTLVYIPCFSTMVAIWRETLSWKWTAFSAGYGLMLAFVLGTVVYQGGHLLGLH